MNRSRGHLHAVTSWLNDLNDITAGSKPLADSKPKIAALASILFEEFPPGAFTRQSLIVVGRSCKFFPSLAEICEVLGPWWKDHQPPLIAIAGDQAATVKQREIERETRESWENITPQQIRANVRALDGHQWRDAWGNLLAAAIQKHAPHHLGLLPPEWLKDRSEPPERAKLRAVAAEIHPEVKRGPPDAA